MEHIEQLAITAIRVSDDDRLGFLPRHFGRWVPDLKSWQ